jgi:hypothetical protein
MLYKFYLNRQKIWIWKIGDIREQQTTNQTIFRRQSHTSHLKHQVNMLRIIELQRSKPKTRMQHKNTQSSQLLKIWISLMLVMTANALTSSQSTIFPHQSSASSSDLIVFIHGRLDVGSSYRIPPPPILYSEFCKGLARRSGKDVLLPTYHEYYNVWREEPRDLGIGPVSSAVGTAIRNHILASKNVSLGGESKKTPTKLTFISFSMGAAILLKLLKSDPLFKSDRIQVEKIILVAPVWRCWLTFAVQRQAEARSSRLKELDQTVSTLPVLVLAGTNDIEVEIDSGGIRTVGAALRPFLPILGVIEIEGGNHFGLCTGAKQFSEDRLVDKNPDDVREQTIYHIAKFCTWE